MNAMKTITAVVALLMMAGFADARSRSRSDGGIHGTITSIGSQGFVISLGTHKSHKSVASGSGSNSGTTTAPATGPSMKVLCDNNTKFMSGGLAAKPSDIKEGMRVAVIGSTLGPDEIQAMTVTLNPKTEHKKKKSST